MVTQMPVEVPNLMAPYRVAAVRNVQPDGYETTIVGPGIPATGLSYWFGTLDEADSFVQNLNLSYSEAKRLSKWRKLYERKRLVAEATY